MKIEMRWLHAKGCDLDKDTIVLVGHDSDPGVSWPLTLQHRMVFQSCNMKDGTVEVMHSEWVDVPIVSGCLKGR